MLDAINESYVLVADSDDPDHFAKLLFSTDSTIARAHQHAAGAPRVPGREAARPATHTEG